MKKCFLVLLTMTTIFHFTGCTNMGPKTVPRDRFDYNNAISDSWKEQTLLNIVKIRYADMPLFIEVASIVSGYTLEGAVNLGGTVASENAVSGDFLSIKPDVTFTSPLLPARSLTKAS